MKQFFFINIISLFLLILFTGCASFPNIISGNFGIKTDDAQIQVAFADKDRRIIYDYYNPKKIKHKNYYKRKKIKNKDYYKQNKIKHKGLPPGLAKKGQLPPGLQKQVQKNGKLPPGLAKRNLPYKLEVRLSPLPRGYVRLKVGGDIVLMNEETKVIIDVIYDIG
jgi:hypothetical protein